MPLRVSCVTSMLHFRLKKDPHCLWAWSVSARGSQVFSASQFTVVGWPGWSPEGSNMTRTPVAHTQSVSDVPAWCVVLPTKRHWHESPKGRSESYRGRSWSWAKKGVVHLVSERRVLHKLFLRSKTLGVAERFRCYYIPNFARFRNFKLSFKNIIYKLRGQ